MGVTLRQSNAFRQSFAVIELKEMVIRRECRGNARDWQLRVTAADEFVAGLATRRGSAAQWGRDPGQT
jgi:hypothetical protein